MALVWNVRSGSGSVFMADYEALLRTHAPAYARVNHQDNVGDQRLAAFYAPDGYRMAGFPNRQHFDFDGLRSRLLSSSSARSPASPAIRL